MSFAYYNEFDPFAAAWLEQLIAAGRIAPGIVDRRSIEDVSPNDLKDFTQHHFFAGIGVWSYALRRAGWSDDTPVWTGSCPCQPFSSAGKGNGFDDERHLWPHFHYLIEQCRPTIVFGEQVASKDGLAWLDLVSADLEATGYAFGAADLCAAGVGAPHIRQRSFWVAQGLEHPKSDGRNKRGAEPIGGSFASGCSNGGLADAKSGGRAGRPLRQEAGGSSGGIAGVRVSSRLADANLTRSQGAERIGAADAQGLSSGHLAECGGDSWPSPTNGFWRDADWLGCRDGKWRPVEPGSFPLAHGAAHRVGRLRGYGNAIVAPVAQIFIESVMQNV